MRQRFRIATSRNCVGLNAVCWTNLTFAVCTDQEYSRKRGRPNARIQNAQVSVLCSLPRECSDESHAWWITKPPPAIASVHLEENWTDGGTLSMSKDLAS